MNKKTPPTEEQIAQEMMRLNFGVGLNISTKGEAVPLYCGFCPNLEIEIKGNNLGEVRSQLYDKMREGIIRRWLED